MSRTSTIGLSRKQKVFASIESVLGTLIFPNATTDGILPVGNAVLNQSPDFANSEELADTLNILDQFQNATPAGTFNLTMYIRPSGTVGSAPQGAALLRSLQGSINGATTASTSAILSASVSTIGLKGIAVDDLAQSGVITIGLEKIAYTGLIRAAGSATATLTGCLRGYAATTATSVGAAGAAVSLSSIFYKQSTTSESFSLWIETDHFVQALSGCSINSATLEISNEGGLKMTFEGQGMQMKWAGSDALAASAASDAVAIMVADATRFCSGMYIYNVTKESGKKLISSSNATTNVITVSEAIGAAWATADVIKGYLPDITEIGNPIEGKDSSVTLNSVAARIKTCSLSIGTPKQYITDEIGSTYPEDFLENTRDINISPMSIYFRKADAKYFKDGFDGNEIPVCFSFGEGAGSIMDVNMKRMKLKVPEVNFNPPAVELNMTATALGTIGEDSLEIVFR